MPYAYCEQIGKEIRDISDEIPFEIPESWEWTSIGNIAFVTKLAGFEYTKNIAPNLQSSGVPLFKGKNVQNGNLIYNFENYISESLSNELIRSQINKKCLLTPYVGTIGNIAIFPGDFKAHLGSNVGKIEIIKSLVLEEYVMYFFRSDAGYKELTKYKKATAQESISIEAIRNAFIPIPPLAEQHRIVAKIEQLLPFIEKYEQAETQLTALNTSFPEMLKKSILQESVQGKLVPQNPFDEPASVLLERIRAKKQELIKQGKIKKDKHESAIITRDKIPYEIPDSWVWCKLSDLAILENGDRSSKYPVEADYVEIGIPFFGAKDIDGDMMSFQNVRFISQQKYDELGNGKLVDGDIICLLRGSVGKTAKFEANEQFDTGFICAQMLIIRLLDKSLFGYISSYFKSPDYTNYVESKVTGTAVRQMPAKEMGNLLIPLPPLAEQHRIVAKIEEIMPMIERLTLR